MNAEPSEVAEGDEAIIAAVRAGETARFERLMRRYNQRLYRVARAIVGDALAEDVMQEAYLQAFRHLDDFEGRSRFSTWLTTIAVREALACRRRAGRYVPLRPEEEEMSLGDDEGPETSHNPPSPEAQVATRELVALVDAALDGLPEPYRTIVVLRDLEGMSTADAAHCLGITEELAKVRLHRARVALRRQLDARLNEAEKGAYAFHRDRCDRVVARVLARIMPTRR